MTAVSPPARERNRDDGRTGWYIAIGLVVMIVTESATLAGLEPFASWNTPIAWSGFILFADSLVYRARGGSWMRSAPREFVLLALVSVPLWILFEGYNLTIRNWYYTGLPENFWLRQFGFFWSFATIWPAIFEAAELVAVWRGTDPGTPTRRERASGTPRGTPDVIPHLTRTRRAPVLSIAAGALMLAAPFIAPRSIAPYLAGPVWLGFIFLLDPINRQLGLEAITRDRLINLTAGGVLCGFLWEFWNYWSRAKWHYTVPIMANVRLFEMPLAGYVGFPAFALECFAMYVFIRGAFTRLGRPIAL